MFIIIENTERKNLGDFNLGFTYEVTPLVGINKVFDVWSSPSDLITSHTVLNLTSAGFEAHAFESGAEVQDYFHANQ
jgi:hypothetical protein